MQQSHIPTRAEADASLADFYAHLGHQSPQASAPRLIRPLRMVAPRLIRQRRRAALARAADLACVAVAAGISLWVGVPVILVFIAGTL